MLETVEWVLRRACDALSSDHFPPHPRDPVSPPFSCIALIFSTRSLSPRDSEAGRSRKNVSCMSRAEWSCGMNSASMFQKAGWT